MTQQQLHYKTNTIAYTAYGSGEKYIFCFHGFGQAGHRWGMLESLLGKQFTLIAFDLPFHGQTKWKEKNGFTAEALTEIIKLLLPKNQQKIYLLGYSMGGRIVLRLIQQIPTLVQKAVLLAPDGLHRNKLYRFITQTTMGRKLFYRCMKNPRMLFSIAKKMRAKGKLSDKNYNMAKYYVDDEASRMALYHRWMSTRLFQPDLRLLKKIITEYHIPVEMVFGKYDKIIVADNGILFTKGLEKSTRMHVLNTGHYFLTESYAPLIASLFDEDK